MEVQIISTTAIVYKCFLLCCNTQPEVMFTCHISYYGVLGKCCTEGKVKSHGNTIADQG